MKKLTTEFVQEAIDKYGSSIPVIESRLVLGYNGIVEEGEANTTGLVPVTFVVAAANNNSSIHFRQLFAGEHQEEYAKAWIACCMLDAERGYEIEVDVDAKNVGSGLRYTVYKSVGLNVALVSGIENKEDWAYKVINLMQDSFPPQFWLENYGRLGAVDIATENERDKAENAAKKEAN